MALHSVSQKIVKLHEDIRLQAYDDKTGRPLRQGDTIQGHPTIGWGRALDVRGVNRDEANCLLENDLAHVIKQLPETIINGGYTFWNPLSKLRKGVLVDMAYNMGTGGLLEFKQMLAALEQQDYDEAALQIEDSHFFTQTGIRGKHDYCLMKLDRWVSEAMARRYFQKQELGIKN
jgi:lysozyme